MKIFELETNTLKPYEKNAKVHGQTQIDNVAESIKQMGWKQPLVVDKDRVIIIGHCRFLAAKKLGLVKVPCIIADDLTDEQVRKLRLIDNKTNESEWDYDLLKVDLDGLDFSTFDFDWDLPEEKKDAVDDNFDFDSAVPETPYSKKGDVFILGEHRLMCGDSTNENDVKKLVGDNKIDLFLSDPPYNVNYTNGQKNERKIKNDNFDTDEECGQKLWKPAFENARNVANDKCSFFVFMPQGGTHMMMMMMMMMMAGWQVKHELIWKKQSLVLNRADYNYQHEPIMYGWNVKHEFYGNGKYHNTSIWEFDRPTASKLHPTMKPIELLGECLLDASKENDNILDLFGGSGSTLIACEQLNRKCFMMELDEKYCDVIIARWEQYTGKKAVKVN